MQSFVVHMLNGLCKVFVVHMHNGLCKVFVVHMHNELCKVFIVHMHNGLCKVFVEHMLNGLCKVFLLKVAGEEKPLTIVECTSFFRLSSLLTLHKTSKTKHTNAEPICFLGIFFRSSAKENIADAQFILLVVELELIKLQLSTFFSPRLTLCLTDFSLIC